VLVLTRRKSERLLIGDDIVLTVIRIGPNSVRLGIDAPAHTVIIREELTQRLPPITEDYDQETQE